MIRLSRLGLLFCMASAWPLLAQGPSFDTSGNGLLSGTYYFRHVNYLINTGPDQVTGISGSVQDAVAVYGSILFDGNGTYTIANGMASDSYVNSQSAKYVQSPLSCEIAFLNGGSLCTSGAAVTGTYSISASGFGYLSNPITGDQIFGLVSANHVFVGSSTETTNAYNDMFIAALIPSPVPTNSFFQGSYSVAGMFPSPAGALYTEDAFFQLNPDGNGNLGTVNVNGYYANGGTAAISQSSPTVKYSFSSGAAVVTFPTNANAYFFQGGASLPEYLYFSQDGNFFFGGSPTGGYDMIVGVRNNSGPISVQGLYYEAGLYQDNSQLSTGLADFGGYYASLNVTPTGAILSHQRVSSIFYGTYDYTFADSVTLPVAASYADAYLNENFAVGAGGAVRIAQGTGTQLGIDVALQAPSFNGAGVYINPTGVVNAASSSPFTAGVSNGEYLAIYGSNLAPSPMGAPSLPLQTMLNGVQVFVNGVAAPINFVSPSQLNIVVPSGSAYKCAQVPVVSCATFKVVNGSNSSNTVTELVNLTTPGLFTDDYGLGDTYAVDVTSGSIVTESHPAQPGDTIEVFASGLGAVFPPVPDGNAAPSTPLSYTSQPIAADIDGVQTSVGFAGLAPTFAGLYQINLTIPSTISSGNHFLNISGVTTTTPSSTLSYNSQAIIPIGSGLSAADRKPEHSPRLQRRPVSATPRPKACFFGAKTGCKNP